MFEYCINGNTIQVNPIYQNGYVGQTVIYGQKVSFKGSFYNPLSNYSAPSIFTIVEKNEARDGYYILIDSSGNKIKIQDMFNGASSPDLYDAQEWLMHNNVYTNEKINRKQRKIEQLEGQVALLKDILVKQGIKIVTEEQAQLLGF